MELRNIPELTKTDPAERLVEFYKKLGWDGEVTVFVTKVRMTEEDWLKLVEQEMARVEIDHSPKQPFRERVGLLWMNRGPSGSGTHPGKVELHEGWLDDEEV